MAVISLVASQVRCYPELVLEGLGPRNLFLAANGAGKSTLLEALYFLSRGKSFRTGITREMKAWDAAGFGIAGGFADEEFQRLKIEWRAAKRVYAIDGAPVSGLAQFWGRWQAVAFSNEDLLMIQGSSSARRQWVDSTIAGAVPGYVADCLKAQQLVRQKSALLKEPRPNRRVWEVLNEQLRAATVPILRARAGIAEELSVTVTGKYRHLAGGRENLAFLYEPNRAGEMEEDKLWESERTVGRPLYGPHRDEWKILLQEKELRKFGSEGQQKSAALAMRLAELERLTASRRRPAVLVDDALQELDGMRRSRFWELLPEESQWMLTATSEPDAPGRQAWIPWSIRGGIWVCG